MKAQFPTAFCKPIPISLPCIHSESGGLMEDCLVQYLTSAAGSSREHPKDTAHLSTFLCPCAGMLA